MLCNALHPHIYVTVNVPLDAQPTAQTHLEPCTHATERLIQHDALLLCHPEEAVADDPGVQPFGVLNTVLIMRPHIGPFERRRPVEWQRCCFHLLDRHCSQLTLCLHELCDAPLRLHFFLTEGGTRVEILSVDQQVHQLLACHWLLVTCCSHGMILHPGMECNG